MVAKLISGDLLLIFFVWYGLTRFALEKLRHDNWTFFGIPTAQLVTLGFILTGLIGLWYRHGPGRPPQTAADLLPKRVRTAEHRGRRGGVLGRRRRGRRTGRSRR